MSDLSMS